jgi:dipeptidyl aminopeptidase/acylaminoacyl peptidase
MNERVFRCSLLFACCAVNALLLAGCQPDSGLAPDSIAKTTILTAVDYQRAEQFLSWNKDEYILNDRITPNWVPDKDGFWYLRQAGNGGKQFLWVDAATGVKSAAFDHVAIAAELTRLLDTEVDPERLPFDAFAYNAGSAISFQAGDFSYHCTATACEQSEISPPTVKPGETGSPDGKWAVYFKDNNLWLREMNGDTDYALTVDGEADNTYGISTGTDLASVTRQRQGTPEAPLVMFSPDGSKLLTQRLDQSQVGMMHLLQHAPEDGSFRPKLYSYRYALALDEQKPMASYVVFDLANRNRVDVDYPAMPIPFGPATHPRARDVIWQSDGQAFYFLHRYSLAKGYAINRVDATTGEVRKIAERTVDSRAFPGISQAMPGILQPVGSEGVIWWSDQSGWGHLYFTSTTGDTRQLTEGNWNVERVVRVDEDRRKVLFTRTRSEADGNPLSLVLSSVSLRGGDVDTLAQEPGLHQLDKQSFSPDGNYFLDSYSSTQREPVAMLRGIDGAKIAEVERADITELKKTGMTMPEPFEVTAADGVTKLWGKLLKPSHFDASKSYPVVDSIYPGPQHGRVEPKFAGYSAGLYDPSGEPQALAELGFIVILVDGRGTPGRSRSFHYGSEGSLLGEAGHLDDHIAAIKELAGNRPWIDLERVGIYGHSGGGYASTHALLVYPDFFSVAVSSAGNHDQRTYIPIWGESYLGEEEGDNYALASNPHLASNLRGKLLLVATGMDDNVHPSNTYQLVNALIKANKDFDLLSLPNANHGLWSSTNVEEPYLIRRTWDYFVTHLKGATPPREYALTVPETK